MLKPLNDLVLIRTNAPAKEKISAGGLFIPGTVSEDAFVVGDVVDVGPDVKGVTAKDRVLFDAEEATKVTIKGEDVFLIASEKLLGIME